MSTTVDPPTGTIPDPMPTSSTLPTTTMPDPPLVDPTKADPAITAAMKKGLSWNSFQQLVKFFAPGASVSQRASMFKEWQRETGTRVDPATIDAATGLPVDPHKRHDSDEDVWMKEEATKPPEIKSPTGIITDDI